MTGLAFKNNAKTTLSSGVNDSTTTIPVTEGSVFPQIDATDPALDVFFFVTLDDDTNNEIVKVTASTGSSGNQNLTVVRAQEGTTARAFSSGDKVELRLTAGMVDTFNLSGNDITLSNNKMGFGDSTPEVSLDLGAQTDSLHVPVGTTAQRPGSPEAGYLRYNSTTGKFEGYTNAWGDLADGSDFLVTNTYTTANASTTAFTISNAVQDEKQLLVFIDGVFQAHNSYSVSGTTVTLSTAPASGREVTIYSALSNLQGANMVIATMTGDNSDTTLDLGVTPVSENNVQVYIDGTYQNKSTYSISGQILTFSTAPPTGTAVEAITHTVLDISAAASSVLIDEFTGNGSTTAFTLAAAPANENNTQVYVGGVYQEKATYSVSGTTLTLTEAPANGVSVEVMSIAVGQINSAIQLSDADGDTKIQVEESSDEDTIRMDVAGTERMVIDSTGVGIGTTSPHTHLVLNGGTQSQFALQSSNTGTGAGGNGSLLSIDVSNNTYLWNYESANMLFGTNNTERVRITSDGDFLARQTSADVYDTNAGSSVRQFWGNQFSASNNTNSRVMIGSASYKGLVGGASVNSGGTKPIVNSYMAFEMIDATAGGEDGVIGFYTSSAGGSGTEKLRVDNVGITRSRNVNAVGQYSSAAGTQWISLADDASIGLTDTTAGAMLVCAYEGGTGSGAIFFANYYAGTTLISSNGSRTFANSDQDGAICVYKSAFSHSVFFKNRTGGTINVFACSVFSAHV